MDKFIINLEHVQYIDDLEEEYVIHFGINGGMLATVKKNKREAEALRNRLVPWRGAPTLISDPSQWSLEATRSHKDAVGFHPR